MARRQKPAVQKIYAAAEQFVDAALRRDDSLFTPGRPVWSEANLGELMKRFVDDPDESSKKFMEKLRGQLEGASHGAIQLMGEVLYFHFLIADNVSGKTKRKVIQEVLGWSPEAVEIPEDLDAVLEEGLVRPGTHYNTGRPSHLSFLIEFATEWKQLNTDERAKLLEDPWGFKEFVHGLRHHSGFTQRAALLHLVHPDAFEPIVAREHKKLIAKGFEHLVTDATGDVDRKLFQIREGLQPEYGAGFTFYDKDVKQTWSSGGGAWDDFVHWAKRFYEDLEVFDAEERTYKLEVMERVAGAREALQAENKDWVEALSSAFHHSKNNLTSWQANDRFLGWIKKNPEEARAALEQLWRPGEVDTDRIREFLEGVPASVVSGLGGRLAIASFLLMGVDPTNYPIYRPTPFASAFKLTGTAPPGKDSDEAGCYDHALDFLDRFMEEAKARGLELRDRLDAQGLAWSIVKNDRRDTWTEKEQKAFRRYRGERVKPVNGDGSTLAELASELLLDLDYLERVERLLRDKPQLIFHGPPGTGKTYVAQRLAEHFAGEEGTVELVQFHPSYAYEDFVEGYRPSSNPAQGAFSLREGPLKRLAKTASDNPAATHVLVIDEINRGNLAKVFGELYFLLEYRDSAVSLQYSDEQFLLPKNLWVIGTMNTADRSIALVDSALRRRFFFVPFFPDEPPVKGLLRRWLEKNQPEMAWVAAIVDLANEKLGDRHVAVGPSYFLRKELDDEWVRVVWDHSVVPYLAEQFFGEEERLREFELDRLRAAVEGKDAAGAEPAAESGESGDEDPDAD
jgi:MoxR-like ATPase